MEITEIYTDADGETHFRKTEIDLALHDFAPPSAPIRISPEWSSTSSVFLVAPPGWDKEYHPTPRKQLAVMLDGEATVTASDGKTIDFLPGNIILLNDEKGKGHLTRIMGDQDATVLLIGVA